MLGQDKNLASKSRKLERLSLGDDDHGRFFHCNQPVIRQHKLVLESFIAADTQESLFGPWLTIHTQQCISVSFKKFVAAVPC